MQLHISAMGLIIQVYVLYCIQPFIKRFSQHKALQKRFSLQLQVAPRKQTGFKKSQRVGQIRRDEVFRQAGRRLFHRESLITMKVLDLTKIVLAQGIMMSRLSSSVSDTRHLVAMGTNALPSLSSVSCQVHCQGHFYVCWLKIVIS